MNLPKIFRRKATEPVNVIMYNDSGKRTYNTPQVQTRRPTQQNKPNKNYGWKTNIISGLMNAAIFSSVVYLAISTADVQDSGFAPLTPSSLTHRQP